MTRLLAALNPLQLALRLGRGALRRVAGALRFKALLIIGVIAAALLVILAAIYTLTAPLYVAHDFADSLRGGAPNLPPARTHCIPDSPAVHAGRYTADAENIISEIPQDVTLAPASAFLLYRWSHIGQQWQPDWHEWQSHLNAQLITDTATDIDIAQTADPQMDYTPYLVAARSTVIDLSVGGSVVGSKQQIEQLADEIYRECQQRDEHRRATSGLNGSTATYTETQQSLAPQPPDQLGQATTRSTP